MAIRMALKHGAAKVITVSADIKNMPLPDNPHTDFEIDWIESGHECLNEKQRDSYNILKNMGIKVNFMVSPNTVHDVENVFVFDEYLDYLKNKN